MKIRRWQTRLLAWFVLGTAGAGCAALPPAAWSPDEAPPSDLAQTARPASAPLTYLSRNGIVRGQAEGASPGQDAPSAPPFAYGNAPTPGSNQHWRYPTPVSGVGAAPVGAAVIAPGAPAPQVARQPIFGAPPPAVVAPLPPPAASPLPPPQSRGVPLAPGDLPYLPESVVPPGSVLAPPDSFADIDVFVDETRTGRFMFGVGVNSDAGVTGQVTIDERNFNIARPPTSFEDILNGTAWRGAGQGFRLEAMPGSQLQRYLVSFTEPYLFNTPISFNTSGYYYNRRFFDWTETRAGGRMGLGYRITHDLSLATSLRAENVEIEDPRLLGAPDLNRVLGSSDLFTGRVSLTHDTRDSPFAATEGYFLELAYEHGFGDFDYPRGELDYRQYFLLRERPDGSGRHTLSYSFRLGFSGSDTPLFERYFAGGYSTMRGFDFRGASPVVNGVTVGGNFQMLGTVEYLFPLTADDMLKGVVFTDFGTVERDIEINADNYRVAPGFGLRVLVPAMGPAPIALDFAFPVAKAPTDDERVFSFFIGFGR